MSRAALLATIATTRALESAELAGAEIIRNGQTGIAYGSCLGGPEALIQLAAACLRKEMQGIPASSYIKVMSHCCASNLSLHFGVRGRLIPTCSACTSGSQGIGFAFETIRQGLQTVMIAGGAEELCVGITGLFDAMCATSPRNDDPSSTPRPFDSQRDGLVMAEGACTFILEEMEHAIARGAPILAEIVGFGTNCDGSHVTNPSPETMARAMTLALESGNLDSRKIGMLHAHATATEVGDIAESQATFEIFGDRTPITALKSFTGHTLGAAGALEAWFTVMMMNEGWVAPIRNLESVDPRCAPLDYVQGDVRKLDAEYVMNNNFAFGGVNTSLIFRRWQE
jgi:3-oxoacyl-[acyl-carrier-protein] synthase II